MWNDDTQAVWVADCAAPECDRIPAAESQPQSHSRSGRSVRGVPDSTARSARLVSSSGSCIGPREKPGATPRKPAVFWPNRCSSVTPTGRVAPGCIFPSGKGGEPAVAVLRSAHVAAARQRRAMDADSPVDAKIAPTGACETAQARFRTAPTAIIFISFKIPREDPAPEPGRLDGCRELIRFR